MTGDTLPLLLMTIRDHPFIDVPQLAHFLGLSPLEVYPHLFKALGKGFLQGLRLRSLARWAERDLYALSGRGVYELASYEGVPLGSYGEFYPEVSRAAYRRALLNIDSLYPVRQLLALWSTRWELAYWATPARAPFTYEGQRFWIRLHGQGWVRCPQGGTQGEWFPVCLEWDEGDVQLEGFRKRFGSFYRWRESQEALDRPEAFPSLVIVTPTRKRALESLYYLRGGSARWQAPLLNCFATSRRKAFERDGAWYRLGAESSPGALLVGVKGLPEPLLPFGEEGGEGETQEDGGEEQDASRKREVFLGPSFSALISQKRGRSRGQKRDDEADDHGNGSEDDGSKAKVPQRPHVEELLRLRLILSPLGLRILKAVARWPFLTAGEISVVLRVFSSDKDVVDREDVRRELGRLQGMGLVEGYLTGDVAYWYLGGPGIELLAAGSPLALRRYARFRGWWVTPGGKDLKLKIGEYIHAWKHTRQVISFMFSLILLAGNKQLVNLDHEVVRWDFCPRIYWHYGSERRSLFPDSVATYRAGDEVYPFFLEVERARGHRERLLERFLRYALYFSCGAYRFAFGDFPQLVIVADREGRARAVRDELENVCRVLTAPLLPAYVTTTLLLDEQGVQGRIWRKVGEWKMQHLFRAFASEPRSAIKPLVVGRS